MFFMARLTKCFALISAVCLVGISSIVHAQSDLKNHDTEQEIDISADRLEVKPKQGRAVFTGAVEVTQGRLKLSAGSMMVFYDKISDAENPSIQRLDAKDMITLTSRTEKVTGEWAVYDVASKLVTIGGAVTLSRGSSVLKGERLELDLVTGLTKLDGNSDNQGRVKGTFTLPKDDSN